MVDAVRSFLLTPNTGILMISGDWGTGKSFFVRNSLIDEIKTTEFCGSRGLESTIPQIIKKFIPADARESYFNFFFPVFVSVFGISSIRELESAIIRAWFDSFTGNKTSFLVNCLEFIGKQARRSKKLNEYFDITSLFDYKPGISSLPSNLVVILDDLERLDEKISETEILGFINNLNENLGLKVIVVANEEYLFSQKVKFADFKEKVVEKTLAFKTDTSKVISSIIESFENPSFAEYIRSNEAISESFDPSGKFSPKDAAYRKALSNLRTIKFALNHFYAVFGLVWEYADKTGLPIQDFDEELKHFWFTILALSIEFKNNRIPPERVKYLDSYRFLNSSLMIFNSGPVEESNPMEKVLLDEKKNPETDSDSNQKHVDYGRTFYEYYFRSRGCNLLPIPSPGLLHFIIDGKPTDAKELIDTYRKEKLAMLPGGLGGDTILDDFLNGMNEMDNTEVSSNLIILLQETEKGTFTHLSSFLNASSYLLGFRNILPSPYSEAELIEIIHAGVNRWFETNRPGEIEKTRFKKIRDSVQGALLITLHDYILSKIQESDEKTHTDEFSQLIELFEKDIPKFCVAISPHAFASEPSANVTYYVDHPVLSAISAESIKKKAETLTMKDSNFLTTLIKNRYIVHEGPKLRDAEASFWNHLDSEIRQSGFNTAGRILAVQTLLPQIRNLLLKH